MGTLYLVDANNIVLANSAINDTVLLTTGSQSLRGSFVVNLPFEVPMDGLPTNLTDLITKKGVGLLAFYPGYTNILYAEQSDSSGWNAASSTGPHSFGDRQTVSLENGADIRTIVSTLLSSPTNCIVRWEVFSVATTNPVNSQLTRSYHEEVAGDLTCQVSFDNGATWTTATNGVVTNVSLSSQGNQFIVRFTRTSSGRRWLGSWALVY